MSKVNVSWKKAKINAPNTLWLLFTLYYWRGGIRPSYSVIISKAFNILLRKTNGVHYFKIRNYWYLYLRNMKNRYKSILFYNGVSRALFGFIKFNESVKHFTGFLWIKNLDISGCGIIEFGETGLLTRGKYLNKYNAREILLYSE